MESLEAPKIKKTFTTLTNDYYKTPNTSLLLFQFEPHPFPTPTERLKQCAIKHFSIANKDVYLLDHFFSEEEGNQMRKYSAQAKFSRNSYGSLESIEKGEKPARSMNNKERWSFFSQHPSAVDELYRLFGMLSHRLDAEVTTLPWDLCDHSSSSPSVIGNYLEEASFESMELGKHRDCHPEKEIPFAIPILYSEKTELHPSRFVNGEEGRPWLISVMLYSTAAGFLPEYRLGTAFYTEEEKIALRAHCNDMRLVFFAGDLIHSIEESLIPADIKTWRVSYVFKLVVNPKRKSQNLKQALSELFQARTVPVGDGVRH